MNLSAIETATKAALVSAGFGNVLTREHLTASQDEVADLYFDKSHDPPQINYLIVTVKREGSLRYASSQVLELGRVDVQVFLAINDDDDTEATIRQKTDTVCDALDQLFTYGGQVDRTLPPVASDPIEVDVKGFRCWKALVSQRFESPKTVSYS